MTNDGIRQRLRLQSEEDRRAHDEVASMRAAQLAAREAAMASRLRRYLWWSLVVLLALVVTFGLIVFGGVTLRGQS